LKYQETLRPTRPYMYVGYTDGTKAASFPKNRDFDTVVCLNVIEHVPDDVGALRNIREVLTNGGRAIVLVPFGPRLYGSLDEVLGHCRRYTQEQLIGVAQQAGFQVEEILKFNRPGVPAWWLNGKFLQRKTFGLGQIRFLNLMTPIFRLIDPWLPLPPLSIIAILRKPENHAVTLPLDVKTAS
jgi:SAM-dependent methyltransferase